MNSAAQYSLASHCRYGQGADEFQRVGTIG
jgi:hypothetical protein